MSQTIILKHSTVKDKLPSSAQYGEVFVNYNQENPFLATLNNQGRFEKFLSENKLNELYYNKSQVNDIIANLESGGTIDFDDYYKKNEVDTLLQGKSDTGHTHDYSEIENTPDLSNFATLSDIPSINGLASEVWVGENYQPKGNYLTEHQSLENYYTKSEADNKFLTSHQDLSDYAQKSDLDDYLTISSASTIYATKEDLEEFTPTVDAYSKEETDTLLAGKANSAHTHDYETLTNKPDLSNFATKGEIPDTSGFATKQELEDYQMKSGMTSYLLASEAQETYQPKGTYVVPSDLNNYITSGYAEETFAKKGDVPTDVYTKSETDNLLAGKANSAHTHSYTALTDLPDLSIYLTEHQDISGLATKQELENYMPNSGMTDYALKSEMPSLDGLATEAELANYQPQSAMTEYVTDSELNTALEGKSNTGHTHSYNDLTDKPILPSTTGLASETWVSNNFSTTAHTHSEYAEKTDLANYMPNSGMTDYALKSEIPNSYTKTEADNLLAGKANSAHTHTMSEITDLDIPKTWRGTLSEYNNLTEIDNDTLYIITDSSEQYVTSGDVESMTSGYTNLTEVQTLLEGYSQTGHTHDYSEIENTPDLSGFASLSDIPDTSNFITSGFCEDRYQPKGTYVVPSDLDDYALKSEMPSLDGLATEAELANYQPVSSMTGYSTTAHTHSYNDLTDKPTIPSTSGLASETWVSNNFAGTGHTHSDLATKAELDDYLTISSASTIYATKEELEEFTPSDNYAGTVWTGTLSEYNNLTVIDTDTLYVITDANQQYVTSGQVESMTSGYTNLTEVQTLLEGYSTTSHTHSYNDLTDKPTIPSTTGLASETWVSQNFQPQSAMTEYSLSGHTHSQYLTETSADSRYARVVSCTQAQYDALVLNDQVEQGVLYCIIEQSNS